LKKNNTLQAAIKASINCKKSLIKEQTKINQIINLIYECIKNDGKIFFCGNGGSASDAQHLTAELLVRLKPNLNRKPIPAICLSMDPSTMTACGNDYNFDQIFSRPFEALSKKNDLLFVISTSGKSKNVLNVLKSAKKNKVKSIGLLGGNGGIIKKYTTSNIVIKSNITARIQETHIFLGHYILENLEKKLIFDKII
jgi:D-sedoheptulose 7-phosphate isomerase|tara:strand:+ start:1579 stop:2169 length:591 start_codon:yes stop_codon:yes gene_type:complete